MNGILPMAAVALPLIGGGAAIVTSFVPPPSAYSLGPKPNQPPYVRSDPFPRGRGPINLQSAPQPPPTATPGQVGIFAVGAGWPSPGGLPQGGVGVQYPQLYDQNGDPLSPRSWGGQSPKCPHHPSIPCLAQYPLQINDELGSWFCPQCRLEGRGRDPRYPGYPWGVNR